MLICPPVPPRQAEAKWQNPLYDDVTGRVIVYFRGLQNDTVDTKSTRRDIIIERIRPFCLNLIQCHHSLLVIWVPDVRVA